MLGSGVFFHTAISIAAILFAFFFNLPVLTLQGLYTYIHPDSLPADGPKALLRRPGDSSNSLSDPRRRPLSKYSQFSFDESKAQLFRIRLAENLLPTRLFFPSYRSAFFSSFVSLSNLALCILLPLSDTSSFPAIPFSIVLISVVHLLISLFNLFLECSASRQSERHISHISAIIGFLFLLFIFPKFSPAMFDFRIPETVFPIVATIAGFISGILFMPASRAARAFWLGTDQLRWNLSIVSCGTFYRVLLFTSVLSSLFSSLLWCKPLALLVGDWKVCTLAIAATTQLLVFRPNVQMYLNESVLCWYQRLHSSRVPDLDYGRAKVFLHNHYVCLAVVQFFAPPLLVLLLVGLSQMRGNFFAGIPLVNILMDRSDVVKEIALFMAWWIMFVRSIFIMLILALYRCGFAFVS